MSESDTLIRTESGRRILLRCPSHLCIQSKAARVIILWTVFIGAVYNSITTLLALFMFNDAIDNVVTYLFNIVYAVLGLVAMLYPLIGFIADSSCGRFKVVISCFCLALFSYLTVYVCIIAQLIRQEYYNLEGTPQATLAVCSGALLVAFISLGGYQANFIQLGLDQQVSAPSKDLALFVHWAMWAHNFGCMIVMTGCQLVLCATINTTGKLAIVALPLLLVSFFLLVLIVSCLKHQWFNSELRRRNPCKIIVKVLNFARKHKYPLRRSAFTYCDDEKPSRLDFAKEKFGGPFTTEQVEDTKSFFKILAVLLALGPLFATDAFSSNMGLMLFGFHTGKVHIVNTTQGHNLDRCDTWVLIQSGNLKYIFGTVLFPIYMWFIFSYLHRRIPRIFVRLFAGMILYLMGELCLLLTDLVGHIKQQSNSGTATLCMFFVENVNTKTYHHLEMHWSAMVAPSILLSVGPLIVVTTALEFISAQSPHFMKGLIVGLFFSIIGVFELVGALALIPFSLKEIWDTASMKQTPPITNCGFGYLLFTFGVALVGLIMFVIVAKKYTYRVRDDKPYNQSQVEEIVSRYLE